MRTKFLSIIAAVGLVLGGLAACNKDGNVPAPQAATLNPSVFADEDEGPEDDIIDESDEGGRAAAIDTAVAVKWKMKLTAACNGTAATGFKYIEGTQTTSPLSATAASSKLGYKGFSIPAAKAGVVLLKTFDKTKSYAIYIKVPAVKKVGDTPAVPAYYKYLTSLSPNPAAEKAMNKAGTKRVGRPITTEVKELACQ